MPKTPTTIGNISVEFQIRIMEIIDDLDMNQKEFAEYTKVSQGVISRAVKYGIYPLTKILIRMADRLNLPIMYLLGKSDMENIYLTEQKSSYHIRVKELIAEKNVNFGRVANRMPFPKEYFYEWQRLKTMPSIEFIICIADYFDVSVDYLLGRTDDKNN